MEFDDFFGELPRVSQRQGQIEQTRLRILSAAIARISVGGEEAVTMRVLAGMVGVTERTVYRHFGSRDELLEAVRAELHDCLKPIAFPETAEGLADRPRRLFPRYEEQKVLVRAYIRNRDRGELSQRAKEKLQEAAFKAVKDAHDDWDARTLRWRAAVIQLITSPQAWDLLDRHWGFDGEEAGYAVAEAVEILLDRPPRRQPKSSRKPPAITRPVGLPK